MPDAFIHHTARNWLLLIEAVTSAGPVDGKWRKKLKGLSCGCKKRTGDRHRVRARRVMHPLSRNSPVNPKTVLPTTTPPP